jgi:hypothetical protein
MLVKDQHRIAAWASPRSWGLPMAWRLALTYGDAVASMMILHECSGVAQFPSCDSDK